MKVYFIDKQWLGPNTIAIEQKVFGNAGIEILLKDWDSEEQVIAGAVDADAIMVVAVPISRKVIEALPNLKFIGRCGIGYDSVDLEAATEKGIVVCNVPDYCGYEVASHSLTLILALQRRIFEFSECAKQGSYGPGNYICHRIRGQKLGLIGYGRIARELAAMARGLGMEVIVYDPYVKESNDSNTTFYEKFEDVLKQADAISVHTPLTPKTKHMISMEQFKMMKSTAVIVNTSRGSVINTPDLLDAVNNGIIAGAGLDVCEGEPLPAGHRVLNTKNIIMTPHVAMYSEEAMEDLHYKITAQALDVLAGRWTRNIVNPKVSPC